MSAVIVGGVTFKDSPSIAWRFDPGTQQLYAYAVGAGGAGGAGAGTPVSVTLSVASTNDYNPGTGFPTGIGRLYINVDTADSILTGLVAGTDGQVVVVENTGTFDLQLTKESASSSAANRFSGSGDAGVVPGGRVTLIYNTTSSRWMMG